MLQAYGRLPIPTREEQVLLGRAVRAWLDWTPSPEEKSQGITEPPRRISRAGERARDQLVSRNMLLVAKQARSFSVSSNPALEIQDLIQEGSIGLCRAAELFDPLHGTAFSTFAVWWIRQSMTRLVHTSGAIRIPTKRSQAMHKLRRWAEAFTAREGRSPSDAEAMEALGLTAGDLVILREAAMVRQLRSLDVAIEDGGDTWLSTVVAPAHDPEEEDGGDTWLSTVVAPARDPEETVIDQQWDLVVRILAPWPVLQEVMKRRLAGQNNWEIGLQMGITERMAVRRCREALDTARWLLQKPDGDNAPLTVEAATGAGEPPTFWQPSLLSLLA